jgi:serine O-acetyltransferase
MKTSLSQDELTSYVARQVNYGFPDGEIGITDLRAYVAGALDRAEYCFSRVRDKYFFDGKQTTFNHLHGDQYAIFLYYLSNTIWQQSADATLASKVYLLNKGLHALDAFYEVKLPDVFYLAHPLGTVLGRATYSNYFVAYQRCTVGSNLPGEYPTFAEGTALFGGSMVIGPCHLAQNCWVAAGAILMNIDVPRDHVAFGQHPRVQFKPIKNTVFKEFFRNVDD